MDVHRIVGQRAYGWAVVFLTSAYLNAGAQIVPKSQGKSEGPNRTIEADPETAARRQEALLYVRGLAKRFQSFQDRPVAVRALTSLASVVCKYDATTAEGLYWKAFRTLDKIENLPIAESLELGEESYGRLRSVIVSQAAKCDGELARKINDAGTKGESDEQAQQVAASALRAALSLREEDARQAARFAGDVAVNSFALRPVHLTQFVMFLVQLRTQSEAEADSLFLQALGQAAARPVGVAEALSILGNYPFTHPGTKSPDEDSLRVTFIGNSNIYILSKIRSTIPLGVTRAYLTTAVQLLLLPVADPGERASRYGLAYQLLPMAREFAPELAPLLEQRMQELSSALPEELTQRTVPERLGGKTTQKSTEEVVGEIDETLDVERREELRYRAFVSHWLGKQFTKAREIAQEMDSRDLRRQALTLAGFGEAHEALEKGETEKGLQLTTDLAPGVKRALLYLVVAAGYVKKGESDRASDILRLSLEDTARVHYAHRPYLLLAVSKVATSVDERWAISILQQAVDALNDMDHRERIAEGTGDGDSPRNSSSQGVHSYDGVEIRVNSLGVWETFGRDRNKSYLYRFFRVSSGRVRLGGSLAGCKTASYTARFWASKVPGKSCEWSCAEPTAKSTSSSNTTSKSAGRAANAAPCAHSTIISPNAAGVTSTPVSTARSCTPGRRAATAPSTGRASCDCPGPRLPAASPRCLKLSRSRG